MPPKTLRPDDEIRAILARHGLDPDTVDAVVIKERFGLVVDPANYSDRIADAEFMWDHFCLKQADGTTAAEGWARHREDAAINTDGRLALRDALANYLEAQDQGSQP